MKHFFSIVFISFIFSSLWAQTNVCNLKFNIKGLQNSEAIFAYHFVDEVYLQDSLRFDANGVAEFKSNQKLPQGMYMVVLPNEEYFDFFITDNQLFEIETTLENPTQNIAFTHSDDNVVFYQFQHFMSKKSAEAAQLRAKKQKETNEKELKNIEKQFEAINKEVIDFQNTFISKNKGSFVANFVKLTMEVNLPEQAKKNKEEADDSRFKYHYYREHYFDNILFTDARLLRTPLYIPKIMSYITEIIPQHPDTVIAEVDKLMKKCEITPEIYKAVLGGIQNYYNQSKIVIHEKVFVHLAKNYYLAGKTPWSSEEYLNKLKIRIEQIEYCLVGNTAKDIVMVRIPNDTSQYKDFKGLLNVLRNQGTKIIADIPTTDQNTIIQRFIKAYDGYQEHFENYASLHQVDALYTILWFWEPSCSHCKVSTPKLRDIYRKYKPFGVEVFAVNIEAAPFLIPDYFFDTPDVKWTKFVDNLHLWFDFIKGNNLNEWINVYDPYETSQFRDYYNIITTPSVYLLDNEKKIMVKNISVENLEKILEELVKEQK